MIWTICAVTGQAIKLADCSACYTNRTQPRCDCGNPAAYQPSGLACSLCGQPTDNSGLRPEGRAYDNSAPLWPLCLDCYLERDPELVQARMAEWEAAITHGETQ